MRDELKLCPGQAALRYDRRAELGSARAREGRRPFLLLFSRDRWREMARLQVKIATTWLPEYEATRRSAEQLREKLAREQREFEFATGRLQGELEAKQIAHGEMEQQLRSERDKWDAKRRELVAQIDGLGVRLGLAEELVRQKDIATSSLVDEQKQVRSL